MSKPHEPIGEPLTIVVPMIGHNRNVDGWIHFVKKRNDGSVVKLVGPPGFELPHIDAAHCSLIHAERDSWGDCLKTGLAGITTPLVALLSLDSGYSPLDLAQLLKAFGKLDVAVATKVTAARGGWHNTLNTMQHWAGRILFGLENEAEPPWRGWPAWRRFFVRRLLFGLRVRDAESGLQLWRTKLVERIPIQSKSRFASAELLVKANFMGAMMTEADVGGTGNVEEFQSASKDFWTVLNRPVFVNAIEPGARATEDSSVARAPGSIVETETQ